ncbi:MAG: FG-GAP-like repeat-containing protein [Gammaproteobacteria bacterium]|nr:FG-GAP-like repeat-containing protein [Gammaproteobacteria bacterium]
MSRLKRLCRFVWLPFLAFGCGGGGGSSSPTVAPVGPVLPPPEPLETALTFELDTATSFSRSFGGNTPVTSFDIDPELFGGGFAAADVDPDGDVDFYVVGGNTMPNHFYRNRGDGTFEEVGTELGLDLVHWGSGPAFGDIDGDGDLDLFVGAVVVDPPHVFENRLDESGRFVDVTDESGIRLSARNTVSATFFDDDQDGCVELAERHFAGEVD